MDILSVKPRTNMMQRKRVDYQIQGQVSMFDNQEKTKSSTASLLREGKLPYTVSNLSEEVVKGNVHTSDNIENTSTITGRCSNGKNFSDTLEMFKMQTNISGDADALRSQELEKKAEQSEDSFDREAVMKAINDSGLLSYEVRSVKISNYLTSLYALARLLVQSNKYPEAKDDILEEIIKQIREYAMNLRKSGKYDDMAKNIMEFEMKTQVFDAFGESVDDNIIYHFMSSTDTDIDRQFRKAESKLGNEGVGNRYGKYFYDSDNPNAYKIDVILYVADDDCAKRLMAYAEKAFHELNDKYRRKMVNLDEKFIKRYNTIVSDGDIVSKHNFRLPETITQPRDVNGREYKDHLFVDDSGIARINLNNWEEGVLEEEQKRSDYVCWLRNPPRKSWSLCVPYEMGGEQKPTYPDFLIVRKDIEEEYVIDILEPHDPTRIDNLGKAKGFAEYARQNPGVGRIELIRMGKDGVGHQRFKRLNMAKSAIRDKVAHAITNEELDHIFDTDGTFME